MPSPRVIIEVSPSALEVATCRGGSIVGRCRTELTLGQWPETWTDGLSQLDAALARAVEELKCQSLPATVIYQGPTPGAVVSITSCATAAGLAAATSAAKLALSNLASFPTTANPSAVSPLYRDRAGDVPHLHMVAAADTAEVTSAISEWLARGGLGFDGTLPAEVAAMLASIEHGESQPPTNHVHAVLWIAGHTSVLSAVHKGRLVLVRPISAGADLLAEALTRPLRPRDGGESSQAITLDRVQARELLRRAGIPAPTQPIPGLEAFDGSAALPWLQPVLQRLALEIKQSLRFGVAEADRASVRLSVAGAGPSIPNLQSTLARLAGVMEAGVCGPCSTHVDAVSLRAHLPLLRTAGADAHRVARTLRRAMLVGVVAAAGLLAFDGVTTRQTLANQRNRLVSVRQQLAGIDSIDASNHTTLASYAAARALQSRVESKLGDAPDWAAAMRLIGKATPSSLRIQELTMLTQVPPALAPAAPDAPPPPPPAPAGGVCTLRGYVFDQNIDGPATIRAYMQKLQGSPLVESVNLTSTQRTRLDGTEGQAFELRITFVGVPVLPTSRPRAVSNAEEARP